MKIQRIHNCHSVRTAVASSRLEDFALDFYPMLTKQTYMVLFMGKILFKSNFTMTAQINLLFVVSVFPLNWYHMLYGLFMAGR